MRATIGHSVFDFIHPDDVEQARTLWLTTQTTPNQITTAELRFRHRSGEWRLLESTGTNQLHNPAVAGIVVNSRDITERKRLEAQFLQAQKMESIGRLAGGVAHDFNNLLTAMLGYADFALDTLPQDSPAASDIQEIIKAGRRAATLTNQLLAFARKHVIAPRILNLNDLLVDIDKLLRRLIGADIEMLTLPAATLGQIRADAGQIEQVIVNLVVNARDAMPSGGKLILETSNVTIDDDYTHQHLGVPPGSYVLLTVSDTGTGMDEETQRHIFEPFFTTKAPGRGSGLGLATCYGIVRQHGGAVWVYSEPNSGTIFKVYLPQTREEVTATPPLAAPDLPRGHETILVVEDESSVRMLTTRILEAQGYTVLAARGGDEALALLHAAPQVDLLLSDVVMPQISGPALAVQIRALRPTIHVLFISGYAEHGLEQHGQPIAGAAFLPKPFSAQALARGVREVLDQAAPSADLVP